MVVRLRSEHVHRRICYKYICPYASRILIDQGHLKVVKLLAHHGTSVNVGGDVDMLNKAGRSAAELASEIEVVKFISEYKLQSECKYFNFFNALRHWTWLSTVWIMMGKPRQRFCCTLPRKRSFDNIINISKPCKSPAFLRAHCTYGYMRVLRVR